MKKIMLFLILCTQASFAAETCYQVSANKKFYAKTPELLCISEASLSHSPTSLTLKTGFTDITTVVTLNLNLVQRAKCMDCNQDVYAIDNPSNSSFNILSVRFNGSKKQSVENGKTVWKEEGTVNIGKNLLYYRSL